MKSVGRAILLSLLSALPTMQPAFGADDRPVVGRRHPEFTLPAIDDRRPVSLSDYRGHKVLLIQFASW